MSEKFDLTWDADRPLLREFLGAGLWSEQDDTDYLHLLETVLKDAPDGGFDVISDARTYTMQNATGSDAPAYQMIADAGGRRFIQVVSQSIVALQAARIIREAGLAGRLPTARVTSMEEALALLPQQ